MMRKPIFTGIATILALALTAGLAYGAGRLVSTRNGGSQAGHQDPPMVTVQRGFHGFNATTFRHQTRQWMRDQFEALRGRMNLAGTRRTSWGRTCDGTRCMDQRTSHRGGDGYHHHSSYQGGSPSYTGRGYQQHSGYNDGDHRDSGSWSGGSYGGWGDSNRGGCCGW
jgi:hypothetical protein